MALAYRVIHIDRDVSGMDSYQGYLADLLRLSRAWAEENTCPSYEANDADEFYEKDIYIALDGDRIVAYAMGHTKVLQESTSYNKVGETAFELDELYVAPSYRDGGVGKALYRFVESALKDQVDVMALIAVSHRYQDLLRFYIDDLGMSFNHALLVKRTAPLEK